MENEPICCFHDAPDVFCRECVKELESKLAEVTTENTRLSKEWQETHDWNNELVKERLDMKAERDSLQKKLLDYEGQTHCCMECERWAKKAERYRVALQVIADAKIVGGDAFADLDICVLHAKEALRQGEGKP